MEGKSDGEMTELRALIRNLVAHMPAEYPQASSWAKLVSRTFADEIAIMLQPKLNAAAKELPQETLEQKRHIASWVNAELRELGLAVRCPRTGLPAILVADFGSSANSEWAGRFRIEVRQSDGHRIRTKTTADLPQLQLTLDSTRKESLARRRPRSDDQVSR